MWRFINTGFRSGKFNMDYDEFLAMQLVEGRGRPAIRVYGWSPYAVSLGYHQDENEIDVRLCKDQNIDVVRRPTGGRAILHAHEVTYSVVTFAAGRGVVRVYEDISRALVAVLRHLGVNAELSKILLKSSILDGTGVSCFARTSKYEVQFEGKKIIGSAQRRYASRLPEGDDVVLEDGSMRLVSGHKDLTNFISRSGHRSREILRHALEPSNTE